MFENKKLNPDIFIFRHLHPRIHIGTASDRYSGWIGQIYNEERYRGRIAKRTKKLGSNSFTEEILPVDSLTEYFEHFEILEIDFTFYRPLLSKDLQPTSSYKVLQAYNKYLKDSDHLVLKVPQVICAKRLYTAGKYKDNPNYLNADMFNRQFYDPANAILGDQATGFVFEQEYHRKQDRLRIDQLASDIDAFFKAIPRDNRYHLELRTESYLKKPVFDVMRDHNVGQVLSHWTWLPRLLKQFAKASNSFTNQKQCIIRLMTPIGMRYEDAYSKAYPFDKMVEGMLQPDMVAETVTMMKKAIEKGKTLNVIINNRAGGNAPLIAREIAYHFL